MLRWAITFFVIALVAGGLGFWGLESTAAMIARVFFVGFVILAILSLVASRRAV
jgi:uncharacterized membrane protein YtjA (UPF0391 family)